MLLNGRHIHSEASATGSFPTERKPKLDTNTLHHKYLNYHAVKIALICRGHGLSGESCWVRLVASWGLCGSDCSHLGPGSYESSVVWLDGQYLSLSVFNVVSVASPLYRLWNFIQLKLSTHQSDDYPSTNGPNWHTRCQCEDNFWSKW